MQTYRMNDLHLLCNRVWIFQNCPLPVLRVLNVFFTSFSPAEDSILLQG